MSIQPMHALEAGVAQATTLRPVDSDPVPLAEHQGVLPLRLDPTPGLPRRPELSVITGGATGAEAFAARLAQAIVEVISGDRGAHQLLRWTTETVYADLTRRATELQRVSPAEIRVRRVRAQVRSVRLFKPRDGVAELSIHARHGHRSRAIAALLELIEGRWRCTVLQFG